MVAPSCTTQFHFSPPPQPTHQRTIADALQQGAEDVAPPVAQRQARYRAPAQRVRVRRAVALHRHSHRHRRRRKQYAQARHGMASMQVKAGRPAGMNAGALAGWQAAPHAPACPPHLPHLASPRPALLPGSGLSTPRPRSLVAPRPPLHSEHHTPPPPLGGGTRPQRCRCWSGHPPPAGGGGRGG